MAFGATALFVAGVSSMGDVDDTLEDTLSAFMCGVEVLPLFMLDESVFMFAREDGDTADVDTLSGYVFNVELPPRPVLGGATTFETTRLFASGTSAMGGVDGALEGREVGLVAPFREASTSCELPILSVILSNWLSSVVASARSHSCKHWVALATCAFIWLTWSHFFCDLACSSAFFSIVSWEVSSFDDFSSAVTLPPKT